MTIKNVRHSDSRPLQGTRRTVAPCVGGASETNTLIDRPTPARSRGLPTGVSALEAAPGPTREEALDKLNREPVLRHW
jgi:hypothetical protein